MPPATPDAAALLAEDRFVRGVAWSLLHDPDLAGDAAQDAWLAALRARPSGRTGLRGWLTVVARNAARMIRRGDVRRMRREEAAARPEGVPSVAEVVEREETRRRVVAAVLSLTPATRDVILLRFFEDLPPREIARRLGIPVNTVRSRTRAGLEALRARLDEEHGGDRRAWTLALLPIARRPARGPLVLGGLSLAAGWKVAAGAAAVGIAAFAVASLVRPTAPETAPGRESASAPALAAPAAGPPGLAALARPPKPPAGAAAPPPRAGPPVATAGIRGRIVDAAGAPTGSAAVWLDADAPYVDVPSAVSRGDGTYELAATAGRHVVRARAPHTATARAEVTVAAGASAAAAPDLVLTPGATIRGRVLDASGRPAPAVRVKGMATAPDSLVIDTVWEGRALHFGMDDVVTAGDGEFVLSGLEAGVPHRVWLELYLSPQYRGEPPEVAGVMPGTAPLELRIVPKNALRGAVLDGRTGRPVTRFHVDGADVRDAQGRFEVPAGVGGPVVVQARGYRDQTQENPATQEGDRPPALVFRLDPDPDTGSLVVVVRDEAGNAVPRFHVQTFSPGFSIWEDDADGPAGDIRLGGVAPGPWRGTVTAPGYGVGDFGVVVPKGDEAKVEIRLRRGGAARLRVLDARGNVARGASVSVADLKGAGPAWRWVYARPQGTAFVIQDLLVFAASPPNEASLSEADGRLEGLPAGRYVLRVKSDDVIDEVPFEIDPAEEAALEVRIGK